jgi:hypothetical protein
MEELWSTLSSSHVDKSLIPEEIFTPFARRTTKMGSASKKPRSSLDLYAVEE